MELPVLIAASTGMRRGEVAGLRTVALPRGLVDALGAHRKEQTTRRLAFGDGWADRGLVLDRGDGEPYDPDTFTHLFAKVAEKAQTPGVRFHDLRHAYATTLLRRGVHPKIVSEALGHSSTSFTMDTYSHVVPSMQRAAADAIEAELS
jgi:integrase